MLPYETWTTLLENVEGHTGYTHQWKEEWFDARFKSIVMFSVDSEGEALTALSQGARYFRAGPEKFSWERLCPALSPKELSCKVCKLCDGDRDMSRLSALARTSIWVPIHGYLQTRQPNIKHTPITSSLQRIKDFLLNL